MKTMQWDSLRFSSGESALETEKRKWKVKTACSTILLKLATNGLQHVFEKGVERCKNCIACQGRYFKKETVTAPPQIPSNNVSPLTFQMALVYRIVPYFRPCPVVSERYAWLIILRTECHWCDDFITNEWRRVVSIAAINRSARVEETRNICKIFEGNPFNSEGEDRMIWKWILRKQVAIVWTQD
jgi:hypothetical protein